MTIDSVICIFISDYESVIDGIHEMLVRGREEVVTIDPIPPGAHIDPIHCPDPYEMPPSSTLLTEVMPKHRTHCIYVENATVRSMPQNVLSIVSEVVGCTSIGVRIASRNASLEIFEGGKSVFGVEGNRNRSGWKMRKFGDDVSFQCESIEDIVLVVSNMLGVSSQEQWFGPIARQAVIRWKLQATAPDDKDAVLISRIWFDAKKQGRPQAE